jgi:hypothetical protein
VTFKFWLRLGLPLLLACGLACAPESGGGAPAPGRDAGPQPGNDGGKDAPAAGDAPADTIHGGHSDGHDAPAPHERGEVGDVPWVDLIDPATWPQTPDAAPAPLPAAAQAVAGELHGAFLRVECASEEIELQYCHPQDKGIREIPLRVGGEPGRTYQFSLRVWGVMETIRYVGGKATAEHFYIGGRRETPMNAEYGLRTTTQSYWLNHMEVSPGDHYTYGIEYRTPAISIAGGSTVTLFVHDPDDFMNTNHMDSLPPGAPPALQARLDVIRGQRLMGQFIYVEVEQVQAP